MSNVAFRIHGIRCDSSEISVFISKFVVFYLIQLSSIRNIFHLTVVSVQIVGFYVFLLFRSIA